jgi:hypothetical protein
LPVDQKNNPKAIRTTTASIDNSDERDMTDPPCSLNFSQIDQCDYTILRSAGAISGRLSKACSSGRCGSAEVGCFLVDPLPSVIVVRAAKQSMGTSGALRRVDCFVASLLAMTVAV